MDSILLIVPVYSGRWWWVRRAFGPFAFCCLQSRDPGTNRFLVKDGFGPMFIIMIMIIATHLLSSTSFGSAAATPPAGPGSPPEWSDHHQRSDQDLDTRSGKNQMMIWSTAAIWKVFCAEPHVYCEKRREKYKVMRDECHHLHKSRPSRIVFLVDVDKMIMIFRANMLQKVPNWNNSIMRRLHTRTQLLVLPTMTPTLWFLEWHHDSSRIDPSSPAVEELIVANVWICPPDTEQVVQHAAAKCFFNYSAMPAQSRCANIGAGDQELQRRTPLFLREKLSIYHFSPRRLVHCISI